MKVHKRLLSMTKVGWLETDLQLLWSSDGTRQTFRRRLRTRRFSDILFFGGIHCGVSESEFWSRMWTVGNGEVEESGVECTLEKQVGVDADAETRGFGGLRLFVLMTSYGMIRCATLASSVSISSKKKKKKKRRSDIPEADQKRFWQLVCLASGGFKLRNIAFF